MMTIERPWVSSGLFSVRYAKRECNKFCGGIGAANKPCPISAFGQLASRALRSSGPNPKLLLQTHFGGAAGRHGPLRGLPDDEGGFTVDALWN
jgi:hypothetical protein